MKDWFLFSALLTAIILTGCRSVSTTAQRNGTIVSYRETKIDGVPLKEFLASRMTWIVAGAGSVSELHSADAITVTFNTLGGKPLRSGKAVAVDSRGYFLTAAHVVSDGPITVCFGEGPSFGHLTARLVWLGDNAPDKPDLALIHIDKSVPVTFAWSQGGQVGDAVFAVGPNVVSTKLTWKGYSKDLSDGLMAGKLLSAPASAAAQFQTMIVTDDLPLHPGDSGGPLTDNQGRLIGINISVRSDYSRSKPGEPKKFTSQAIRPDPAWLQQLIEEDFNTHKPNHSSNS